MNGEARWNRPALRDPSTAASAVHFLNLKLLPMAKQQRANVKSREAKLSQDEFLDHMRHSLAHVLAQAVLDMFPEAKLGVGPTIENGFYYDFELPRTLIPEDLEILQKKMDRIVSQGQPFVGESVSTKVAKEKLKKVEQPFKVELVEDLEKAGEKEVSFYANMLGEKLMFVDLCRGGHLDHTGKITKGSFKLTKISGAYWRGDEKRPMLQRIYGVAFKTKHALNEYLVQLEEAKKRDHRKLGMELDLFQFNEISPGSAFFHPKGATLFNELTQFMRREYRKRGYSEVITPLIYDKALWEQSGHWEHYQENMFVLDVDDNEASLKPMNCPSHMVMFKMRTRSYRNLPIRFADFAMLHRNELKGALGGLTRVRKFSQDDAHIFVREDQIESEVVDFIAFLKSVYELFGFDFDVVLSTRPEKSMGTDKQWKLAEKALETALKKSKMPYEMNPGDGAFYGPKIDFRIKDSLKREWQCGTIQLDFQQPLRFELEYEGKDGKLHRPVVLHRAIFGSLERFIAIITEHFAGAFPFWLAPEQMRVLPLSEKFADYAETVRDQLFKAGFRVEADYSDQTLGKKIREAETTKIPVMLIVGEQETKDGTITARYYGKREQETFAVDALIEKYADSTP